MLFLDARQLYRQIDRAHRDWSESQIGFLANIVRLYRREAVDACPASTTLAKGTTKGVTRDSRERLQFLLRNLFLRFTL